jgi:very-short-patch-repair endonuclease
MKKIVLDPEQLRRMHWDEGVPVYKLAQMYSIGQMTMYRRFREFGIPWRGQSEAQSVSLSKLDAVARRERTDAAIRAYKLPSHETRVKMAQSKQKNAKLSGLEAMFAQEFDAAGLSPIPQYAVGRFNIDFAFPERMLGIELDPDWHKQKREQDDQRDARLREQGWTIIRWRGLTTRNGRPKAQKLIQSLFAVVGQIAKLP